MRQLTNFTLRAGIWRGLLLISTILLVASCDRGVDPVAPVATVTVGGTVITFAGDPVAGATVSIGAATTTTGSDGRFELTNVVSGPATLRCSAAGFEDFEMSVTVPSASVAWDILLAAIGTVSGTVTSSVTGGPVAGAEVSIGSATTTTGADGRFELANIGGHWQTLRCIAPGFFDFEGGILMVTPGGLTLDISLSPVPEFEGGTYDVTMVPHPNSESGLDGTLTAVLTLFQEEPGKPQIRGTIGTWRDNGALLPWGTTSVSGSFIRDREVRVGGTVMGGIWSLSGTILDSGDIAGTWCFDWWVCGTFTAAPLHTNNPG
ncbi:MAG: carboxypeptidase regulatory-like domain-containing protein [Gemmatimonadaceae bacterium]